LTALLLLADAVISVAAGAAFAELVDLPLRLVERLLLAAVVALVLGPAASYAFALLFGLNTATVLLGPAALLVVCGALVAMRSAGFMCWRAAWAESWAQWRRHGPWVMVGVVAFAVPVFSLLFAHTLFMQNGELSAGFQTVWADWSQHLSTQASFAAAGNVSTNSLYADTPLLYPFVGDFQSATLVTLGLAAPAALALPGALLALIIVLLVVRLALRLGLGRGAGIIAAAITFVGGGLGFVGVFADACQAAGSTAAQCTSGHVFGNLGDGVRVVAGTLRSVPGVLAAQERAYDALLTSPDQQPLPNMQWYTPLFAWWLPQRTLLYGFASALCILLLVVVALRTRRRTWPAFLAAGALLGVMPVVHAQTFIALVIILSLVALFHLRREWLAFAGVALVIALPRLVQLGLAPHGSVAFGNSYPTLQPGWLSGAAPPLAAPAPGVAGAVRVGLVAVGDWLRAFVTPGWWGFWFVNLGVAVPVSVSVAVLAAIRHLPGSAGGLARRLLSPFPQPLLAMALAGLALFALCNLVVFQSWNWDNTKLFVYWYLAASLLIAGLAEAWWRRGLAGKSASALTVGVTLLTGIVVLLRLLPWTPPVDAVGGPYTLASADERALAATLVTRTAGDAVFLTFGRPNDPVLALAGRTGLIGYYGWLWSYGIDFDGRYADVRSMYRGCAPGASCPIYGLLRKYHVSYVEIDDRTGSPGAIEPDANPSWWAARNLPVVARSQHIVVYDVRRL
jgi:hypothetical protein